MIFYMLQSKKFNFMFTLTCSVAYFSVTVGTDYMVNGRFYPGLETRQGRRNVLEIGEFASKSFKAL